MQELLARVRAATRRTEPAVEAAAIQLGDITVDLAATTATRSNGERIHLTPTEWHLLTALMLQPGRLVTSRALLTDLARSAGAHRSQLPADIHGAAAAQARTGTQPASISDHRTGDGLPLSAATGGRTARRVASAG